MDEEYDRIFNDIYRREITRPVLEGSDSIYSDLEAVIDGIEEEFRHDNLVLRADAKVALITNALNLGALPLAMAGRDPVEFMDAIRADVRSVAFGAPALTDPETDGREISSRAIFRSAVQRWPQLQLSVPDWWA